MIVFDGDGQFGLVALAVAADLYTCPDGIKVEVRIFLCNTTAAPIAVRLAIAKAGAADSIEQYIYYDIAIPANDTLEVADIPLSQTDVVRAYAAAAGISANVFVQKTDTLIQI